MPAPDRAVPRTAAALATVAAVFATLLLAGCQASAARNADNYRAYITTLADLADRDQRPLVQIKSAPGQPITGLESITVYAPGNVAEALARVAPPQREPSGWEIAGSLLNPLLGHAVTAYGLYSNRAVSIAGIHANRDTAINNQNATAAIAGYIRDVGTAASSHTAELGRLGFQTIAELAAQAGPTIHVGGNAAVNTGGGSARYTGDNSGRNSGNSGNLNDGADNRNHSSGPCTTGAGGNATARNAAAGQGGALDCR